MAGSSSESKVPGPRTRDMLQHAQNRTADAFEAYVEAIEKGLGEDTASKIFRDSLSKSDAQNPTATSNLDRYSNEGILPD